ncbi:MAG: hypothetical protein HYU99_06495 [Deltaproteobacteria bacterium]|nr:hypothetical protein [Deltaproteobacteria bacterium]
MTHLPYQIKGPIYVLGGGPLACHYIGEIVRAKKEGLIDYPELFFIDPHSNVPAAEEFKNDARTIQNTYTGFLEETILNRPRAEKAGILIPDHSAPHVLFRVFLNLIENDGRFKGRRTQVVPFPLPGDDFPQTPFLKTFDSGICAVSYAEWTCPLSCEEPGICPAISRKRDWNFNETFSHYMRDHHMNTKPDSSPLAGACPPDFWRGPAALSTHLFSCLQLAHAVAFIPMDHIFHEWDRLAHRLESQQKVELLVATFSKCHGIIGKAIID